MHAVVNCLGVSAPNSKLCSVLLPAFAGYSGWLAPTQAGHQPPQPCCKLPLQCQQQHSSHHHIRICSRQGRPLVSGRRSLLRSKRSPRSSDSDSRRNSRPCGVDRRDPQRRQQRAGWKAPGTALNAAARPLMPGQRRPQCSSPWPATGCSGICPGTAAPATCSS